MTLSERDSKVIWHPYTQMQTADPAIGIVRGEGAYLYAEDGRRYLDMVSSWWVNLHGHSHPYIAERISAQLRTLEQVIFAGFTHPAAIELAERLIEILPGPFSRVFYSDNGSTAVEVALKMALQFWYNKGIDRKRIIAFQDAYHGDTFGAMAASGRSVFTRPFTSMLFDVHFVEPPLPGREEEAIGGLKALLKKHNDFAAFIYEPLVQGTAGMRMYPPGHLDEMIRLVRAQGIITIADEVMTGFGRTGRLFAGNYLKHPADLICLSKGLTGGTMPLGVTACSDRIYNAFLSEDKTKALFHGHSFTANPLACTAGLASLDLLLTEGCQEAIRHIGQSHEAFLKHFKEHPALTDIRQQGTILALELKTGDESSYLSSLRDWLYRFFLNEGILMRPLGNIVYLIPPYCTASDDLQYVYRSIEKMLDSLPLQ